MKQCDICGRPFDEIEMSIMRIDPFRILRVCSECAEKAYRFINERRREMIIHCQNCGSSLKSRRNFGFEKCPKCGSLIKVMRTFGTGPQTHFFYEVVSCDPEVLASDSPGCYGTFTSKKEAEAKCDEIGRACIETYSMDDKTYAELEKLKALYNSGEIQKVQD